MQESLSFFAVGLTPALPQDRQKEVHSFPDQIGAVEPATGFSSELVKLLDDLKGETHSDLGQINVALRRAGISLGRVRSAAAASFWGHVRRKLRHL